MKKLILFIGTLLCLCASALAEQPVTIEGRDLGGAPLPEPWISDKPIFLNFPTHRELANQNLMCCPGEEIESDCFATYFNWIAAGHTFVQFEAAFYDFQRKIAARDAEIARLEKQCQANQPELTQYLWKPVSERDGNVVVLTNPAAEVTVIGDIKEKLADGGPSNGFASTLRSRNRCATFGNNIRLDISIGGVIGKSIAIGNGCIRQEQR